MRKLSLVFFFAKKFFPNNLLRTAIGVKIKNQIMTRKQSITVLFHTVTNFIHDRFIVFSITCFFKKYNVVILLL